MRRSWAASTAAGWEGSIRRHERIRLLSHAGGSIEDWGVAMKLYRINKLSRPDGPVIKKKDVLAASDAQAIKDAAESDDWPVCEVMRDGQRVGSVQ